MKTVKIFGLVVLSSLSVSGLLLCGAIYGQRFYQQDQTKQDQVQDVPIPQWQREANAAVKKETASFSNEDKQAAYQSLVDVRKIQDSVKSGLNYEEYKTLVSSIAPDVSQQLRLVPAGKLKDSLADSMVCYQDALKVWNKSITGKSVFDITDHARTEHSLEYYGLDRMLGHTTLFTDFKPGDKDAVLQAAWNKADSQLIAASNEMAVWTK